MKKYIHKNGSDKNYVVAGYIASLIVVIAGIYLGFHPISTYGEAILLGSPRGAFKTDATEIFNHVHYIHRGSITFKGALEWRFPTYQTDFVKHSIERNSKIVMNLINNKSLNIQPLLTHELNPEDAAKGYEGLKNNQDKFLGVIFKWTNKPE